MYEQYTTACAGPLVVTAIPPIPPISTADNVRAYFITNPPYGPIEMTIGLDCEAEIAIIQTYSVRCLGLARSEQDYISGQWQDT